MPDTDEQMIVRTTVRFDEDVYDALNEWADDHDRSMNWAVNDLLRTALPRDTDNSVNVTEVPEVDFIIKQREANDPDHPLGWFASEFHVVCHLPNIGDRFSQIVSAVQSGIKRGVRDAIGPDHSEVAVLGPWNAFRDLPYGSPGLSCTCPEDPCWHVNLMRVGTVDEQPSVRFTRLVSTDPAKASGEVELVEHVQ